MRQSRDVRAFGMAPFLRLLQLLRVTEQNETSPGGRASKNVRQRHLARLVDKKNVHRIAELFSRPEPGSPAEDIDAAAPQTVKRLVILVEFTNGGAIRIGIFYFVSARNCVKIYFRGCIEHIVKKAPDHFMADRRNANLFPCLSSSQIICAPV